MKRRNEYLELINLGGQLLFLLFFLLSLIHNFFNHSEWISSLYWFTLYLFVQLLLMIFIGMIINDEDKIAYFGVCMIYPFVAVFFVLSLSIFADWLYIIGIVTFCFIIPSIFSFLNLRHTWKLYFQLKAKNDEKETFEHHYNELIDI